jgi:ribosomal protein L3 glutamine methyltransferase
MTESLLGLVEQVEWSMNAAGIAFGHGTDNAFDEAAWLVAHAVGIDLSEVDDLPWDRALDKKEIEAATNLLKMRLDTRKPLAYLINEAWFAGERFYVDERVIVPRSHLGEWIVDRFEPWVDPLKVGSILDLCTGCGCIAVAAALNFPHAQVTATDISEDALEVARRNVEDHAVQERVRLLRGDLLDALEEQQFDLILCNPPYVADSVMFDLPDEYRHEPEIAFRGGANGLDLIDRLLMNAGKYLSGGGVLVIEVGSSGAALQAKLPEVPFTWLATGHEEPVIFLLSREELDRHFASGEDTR